MGKANRYAARKLRRLVKTERRTLFNQMCHDPFVNRFKMAMRILFKKPFGKSK